MNKITPSLNIFVRKTNDVIIFPMLYIRPSLSIGHHQSERFLYSYNKTLKVKKSRLFTLRIDIQLKSIKKLQRSCTLREGQ